MARTYIDGNAQFVKKDMVTVDMLLPDGSRIEDLEPHRLFPNGDPDRYISLLDQDGKEHAILRDLALLPKESAEVIRAALAEYYILPKITAVLEVYEKGNINRWTVMTDHGECSFQIRSRYNDIKPLPSGRVLIKDSNDNRYEIPDVNKLDRHSLHELNSQI